MSDEKIDISPLVLAIMQLEIGLAKYQAEPCRTLLRIGLFQRFEFIYKVGYKTLKRYLEYKSANPEQFDELSFQDLILTANKCGLLLGDCPSWREYR